MKPREHESSDPIQAASSQPRTVTIQQCNSCLAILPLEFFGLTKYRRNGHSLTCKACMAQYARFKRRTKFKMLPIPGDDLIRNVESHNRKVLNIAFQGDSTQCLAFCPKTNKDYKVIFGKSANGLSAMSMFDPTGDLYKCFEYSGGDVEISKRQILALIDTQGLRLELSEGDMFNSKTIIYLF